MRKLYDLVAADGRRFSPYCWRAKLALAHKGLEVETVPVRFTEIPGICGGGQTSVPVLDDGGRLVRDSFAIAEYLEDAYPDLPTLFGGTGGRSLARFVEGFCFSVLHAQLMWIVVRDIWERLAEEDRDYFRASRERRLGRSLEEAVTGREERLGPLRDSLGPIRHVLRHSPFLGGEEPLYPDHILFGSLQWARAVSEVQVLADDDPIAVWFGDMLERYEGRGMRTYE